MANNVFTKSENFKSEYSCAIVRVGELTPIEGSDFLAKTLVMGTQIVVRKDQVREGDIMVYAANETQLNERFLSVNNLFEIGCRDKNANADEVNAIMSEYEPIKAEADKKRSEAKSTRGMMESYTNKAQKIKKTIKKKEKDASKFDKESDDYALIMKDVPELQAKADEYVSRAMSLTTKYTNLKKDVEDIVKSGEHIVTEAKKYCGFFNKYGRVRCLTLRGCASFGFLFSPAELFRFDNSIDMSDILEYEGQEFDTVNGELFAKAFVPPVKENPARKGKTAKAQKKISRFDRMISGEFFFHYETEQFQKHIMEFNPDDVVDISVKMHGTSIIIGNLRVKSPLRLPFLKMAANKFIDATGMFKSRRFKDWEEAYGPVYSSRKVIKNQYINKDSGPGFYGKDLYSEWGDVIYPYLPKGMTIYGEVCGYFDDKLTEKGKIPAIQDTYDYGCEFQDGVVGESILMIYRITTTNDDGTKREWEVSDVLEWTKALAGWMKTNGDDNWKRIHPIDVLYHGTLYELYPQIDVDDERWHVNLLSALRNDKECFGMEENEPMCTHYESPREGICIRKVGSEFPRCYKLKTDAFSFGEAIRYDNGDVDIEAEEGYA